LELNEVLERRGAAPLERLAVLQSAPDGIPKRFAIAAQEVACCLEAELWDRAIDLLGRHIFHRWEMEFRMRGVYVGAYLGRGIERADAGDFQGARTDFEQALEYPENLRIGKPPRPADARAHWCAGVACEALGEAEAARAHWEAAAAEDYHHAGKEPALCRALSLQKLGRTAEAEALFREAGSLAKKCAEMAPEDAGAQLALGLTLKAMGRTEEAAAALKRTLKLDPGLTRARRLLETDVVL
jgi:tetratricopeptide (TPR) repeat protein